MVCRQDGGRAGYLAGPLIKTTTATSQPSREVAEVGSARARPSAPADATAHCSPARFRGLRGSRLGSADRQGLHQARGRSLRSRADAGRGVRARRVAGRAACGSCSLSLIFCCGRCFLRGLKEDPHVALCAVEFPAGGVPRGGVGAEVVGPVIGRPVGKLASEAPFAEHVCAVCLARDEVHNAAGVGGCRSWREQVERRRCGRCRGWLCLLDRRRGKGEGQSSKLKAQKKSQPSSSKALCNSRPPHRRTRWLPHASLRDQASQAFSVTDAVERRRSHTR